MEDKQCCCEQQDRNDLRPDQESAGEYDSRNDPAKDSHRCIPIPFSDGHKRQKGRYPDQAFCHHQAPGSSNRIDHRGDDLEYPVQINPGRVRVCIGVPVGGRYPPLLNNQLSSAQVPPYIGIDHPEPTECPNKKKKAGMPGNTPSFAGGSWEVRERASARRFVPGRPGWLLDDWHYSPGERPPIVANFSSER